jgi:hypothetical protein
MSFYAKIKWVLGILLVFVLIVATNLIDRNNFVLVRDSVQTIYEDRLVVKDLIFKISKSMQQKELALAKNDSAFFKTANTQINASIENYIDRYAETKLTAEESRVFNDLKVNMDELLDAEGQLMQNGYENPSTVLKSIGTIRENLDDLSDIQLNEGSRQMTISKRAVESVELFTQMEIYLLVFLAIVIQIIVMYNPKEKS